MANYCFVCSKCNSKMEFQWSIKDYDEKVKKAKCLSCKSKKISRDYEDSNIYTGVREIKTIGQLAEANAKKNKSRINEAESMKPKKEKAWYQKCGNADVKTINKMNEKQKIRYIMEGKS